MNAISSEVPLFRWKAARLELWERGIKFALPSFICPQETLTDPPDQRPWASASFRCISESARFPISEVESVFASHGLTVVNLSAEDDPGRRYLGTRFRVWFHPSERLEFLENMSFTTEELSRRMADIKQIIDDTDFDALISANYETARSRITRRQGIAFISTEYFIEDSRYGKFGRLTVAISGDLEGQISVVLGPAPVGWTGTSASEDSEVAKFLLGKILRQIAKMGSIGSNGFATWDVIGTAVTTAMMLPFMQAFASQAGHDCYTALRSLIGRRSKVTYVRDPEKGTELVFRPPLPDEAIVQLANMKPGKIVNCRLVWDEHSRLWKVSQIKDQHMIKGKYSNLTKD